MIEGLGRRAVLPATATLAAPGLHAPARRRGGDGAERQAIAMVANDFAYGHEQAAGFQLVFVDAAGPL